MKIKFKKLRLLSVTLSLTVGAVIAHAHGNAAHTAAHHEPYAHSTASDPFEHAFGKQGDARKVDRTITIDMTDDMRFAPGEIQVQKGETIRFVVANKGAVMHEMVIGTMEELKAHGDMMKMHPGMTHQEPYMAHVSPGGQTDLVWEFSQPGAFYYACLIAGHLEAGMIGKIIVTAD